MKKVYILLIAIGCTAIGKSQVSEVHEVIGSAGEQLETNNGSVNFTVGEAVMQSYENQKIGIDLTQGFQQTYFQITDITENPSVDFDISVWPNPTIRYINIDVGEGVELENIYAEITDVSGVKLEGFNVIENPKIDLDTYPVSSYFLRIYDTQSMHLRLFKIIKL